MNNNYTLITGAASGIGQSIAKQLSRERKLLLCDKNSEGLKTTISSCNSPESHLLWECDLDLVSGIKPQLERMLREKEIIIESFIHSAGMIKVLRMKDAGYENTLHLFNVNFFSAAEITSALLKKNINKESLKNIIFISAILGKFGAKGHNIYSATKGALDGLMRSLALELAPGIRVNSILPGGVRTPMAEAALNDPEILARSAHDYPLGLGEPSDIANLVEFLLSEKSKWITGQQIIIDGGRTANMSQK